MQSYNEILKKVTCNGMRELTPERAEQAAKDYAEQAIDRCAEEADNIQNTYFAQKLRKIKFELK